MAWRCEVILHLLAQCPHKGPCKWETEDRRDGSMIGAQPVLPTLVLAHGAPSRRLAS